jgi:flagellar basal body-associated protein FliL
MGFSWTRKRPTVATIGRARQSKNLAVMVVVVMVMMVMVMVGMAGVMRFGGDRRQGNRGGQRQRGDDSI